MSTPLTLVVVSPEGEVSCPALPDDPEARLDTLQGLVKGRIAVVDLGDPGVEAIVNEEGMWEWAAYNDPGSAVAATFPGGGLLWGPVVFTGGVDAHGETVGLSDGTAQHLMLMGQHAVAEISTAPGLAERVLATPEMQRSQGRFASDRIAALTEMFGPPI